jgi:hypothetical protein
MLVTHVQPLSRKATSHTQGFYPFTNDFALPPLEGPGVRLREPRLDQDRRLLIEPFPNPAKGERIIPARRPGPPGWLPGALGLVETF